MARPMLVPEVDRDAKKALKTYAKKGTPVQAKRAQIILGLLAGKSNAELALEFKMEPGSISGISHQYRNFGIDYIRLSTGSSRAPKVKEVKAEPVKPAKVETIKLNKKELILKRNELLLTIKHLPIYRILRKAPTDFGRQGQVWSQATFGEIAYEERAVPFKPHPTTISLYLKEIGFNWAEFTWLSKEISRGV